MKKIRETSGGQRPLKIFAYSGSAGPGLAKLSTADRYNYVTISGSAVTGRVLETYSYLGRGGRVSERQTDFFIGPTLANTWKQSVEYTPLGEIDLVDYPYCPGSGCVSGSTARRSITYGFSRGWLTSVEPSSGSNWADLNYHANGQVHEIDHRNNVTVTQALDPNFLSRPASISTSGVAGGGNWISGQYTFDGSGNVVWIGGSLYLYDPVSRVKSARVMLTPSGFGPGSFAGASPEGTQLIFADGFESGSTSAWTVPSGPTSGSQSFSYDAFGNLLEVLGDPGISIPVNSATNKLTAVGSNPYDTAGNMTSWNGNSYSYGPFNETWRVVTSNQEWVHVYTADDERLLSYQVVGGVKRRWTLRGLDNRVLREYVFDQSTSTGVIERDNIYRGSGPLLAAATPAGDRHYHVDHLGTPRQITDATGAQVAFHTYYPYGEEATSPTQDTVRLKFTGHERDLADPTTTQDDLDHMHARMTNPKLGRFLSVDPAMASARARSPQSWNRYSYVSGNPTNVTDPTGEFGILAIVWPVAETALTGMDVWETAKTLGDADRSGAEKIVKVGLTVVGAVTIGGGATKLESVVGGLVKAGERMANSLTKRSGAVEKAGEELTYLYQKVGARGEHLKFGITKNPTTRYTQEELEGGGLRIIARGERREMLALERQLHETLPIGAEERQLFYIQKQVEKGLQPPPYNP